MTDSVTRTDSNAAAAPHECHDCAVTAAARKTSLARTAMILRAILIATVWLVCASAFVAVVIVRPGDTAMISNAAGLAIVVAGAGTGAILFLFD